MKKSLTALLLSLGAYGLNTDSALAIDMDSSTLSQMRWATNIGDSRSRNSQLVELTVKPEITAYFDNDIKLTTIFRLRAESIDGLQTDNMDRTTYSLASKPVSLNNASEFELREFFFEKAIGDYYLSIGKQQIVWGKADGLKVLDIVNPQSFREFILESFEDSRIPLWAVNIEWSIGANSDLQFIWIPDQTTHALPKSQGTYAFTTPRLIPAVPEGVEVILRKANRPAHTFANSDIGVRWRAFLHGWDLTLNYLYHYDDFPVLFQQLDITAMGPIVTVSQEYKRSHLLGGTFSNTFGDLTIRGELGYATDRYFLTNTPISVDVDGVSKHDELSYVLGFDWYGLDESLISLQLFQSHIINATNTITRPENDTTLTILAQKEFLNDTLTTEILLLKNLDDNDELIRPKLTYEWLDDLKLWVSVDIFRGNVDGLFGQYKHNDRFLIGIEYGF